jgi:hypothetical protein
VNDTSTTAPKRASASGAGLPDADRVFERVNPDPSRLH